MTREQIEKMEAGEAMDAAISERVMGIYPRAVRAAASTELVTVWTSNPGIGDGLWTAGELSRYGAPPSYSTSIAAAWLVVERIMSGYSREVTVEYGWLKHPGEYWHCHMGRVDAIGSEPTIAICRAALLATHIENLVNGG
jgi:hypothetical protein